MDPLSVFAVQRSHFYLFIFIKIIPQITTLPWYTTLIPLVVVLGITAIKDLVDDLVRRHCDDGILFF